MSSNFAITAPTNIGMTAAPAGPMADLPAYLPPSETQGLPQAPTTFGPAITLPSTSLADMQRRLDRANDLTRRAPVGCRGPVRPPAHAPVPGPGVSMPGFQDALELRPMQAVHERLLSPRELEAVKVANAIAVRIERSLPTLPNDPEVGGAGNGGDAVRNLDARLGRLVTRIRNIAEEGREMGGARGQRWVEGAREVRSLLAKVFASLEAAGLEPSKTIDGRFTHPGVVAGH